MTRDEMLDQFRAVFSDVSGIEEIMNVVKERSDAELEAILLVHITGRIMS